MSVDEERRLNAEALLRQVRLQDFGASPPSIEPFGLSVLSWRISAPEVRPPIRFRLAGAGHSYAVSRTGRRTVSPVTTSSYSLIAFLQYAAGRSLAARVIEVDTSQCVTRSVTEAEVRVELTPRIDGIIADYGGLSRRRADRVEIEYAGLYITLRLRAAFEYFGDQNINFDIDMLVRFRAEQGRLRYRLVSYSVDVDFPGYDLGITTVPLPEWLADLIEEGEQASIIRTRVTEALEDFVAEQQAAADAAAMRFLSVVARPDALDVVLCPADDEPRQLSEDRARPEGPGLAPSNE